MSSTKGDAIQHFYAKCGQMVASFGKKLEAKVPPPIIYHYTDNKGLKGFWRAEPSSFTIFST